MEKATNIYQNSVKKESLFRIFWFEHGLQIIILSIFLIVPFIIGFVLSAVTSEPLSEEQYSKMEKVAYSVYEQKLNNAQLYEIPGDYNCSITETTITISKKDSVGIIEAKLKDGKLITTRDEQNSLLVLHHIACGMIFAVFGSILLGVFVKFVENSG